MRKSIITVMVERSERGVEEVGEGRWECVCNVMKERTEQEEVGAGRAEGGEGVKERGAGRGGGRVGERGEGGGGGRGARQEGREGENVQKHRGVGGTECSGERGEGEVKDRGREHEEEAEEEGREGEREGGGRDQLMPDGFQQNKCVFT